MHKSFKLYYCHPYVQQKQRWMGDVYQLFNYANVKRVYIMFSFNGIAIVHTRILHVNSFDNDNRDLSKGLGVSYTIKLVYRRHL